MSENEPASAPLRIRFWAGARAAAGTDEASVADVADVDELRAALTDTYPGLATVLPACSLISDGATLTDGARLGAGASVDVLPPFAGG